ncbi:hypothetical protein Patl1_00523 [Pistacia atlantica]|uniref:Uncharacterized protein n=1 Tax=Pistacia atlantica TaxID=434234 RepID=A0ACC1C8Q3_9ROSI|nr:hypothetical protein Patl1_00523 [Pistacia atlantica]
MEKSHPLAIESFSSSWLSNTTSLNNSREVTSKELDGTLVKEALNFNFDIPTSPVALLHADELFSDGLIKPVFVDDPSEIDSSNSSDFITVLPGSSFSVGNIGISSLDGHCDCFIKWKESSQRIIQKCFGHIRSLCNKAIIRSSRKSIRVNDIDRRLAWEVKRCSNNSPQASPQRSTAYSVDDWCDIESSIHEAILHCKRSIGMFIDL